MVSKIEPDRYADTGFSVADTPPKLNAFLFQQMMRKSGSERLIIGCQMTDSARQLVWSGIPSDLPESKRRTIFMHRFYGETLPSDHCSLGTSYELRAEHKRWNSPCSLGKTERSSPPNHEATDSVNFCTLTPLHMIPPQKQEFIKRWQSKSQNCGDDLAGVFDRFFSSYVLYNFLYNEIYALKTSIPTNQGIKPSRQEGRDIWKACNGVFEFLGSTSFNEPEIREQASKLIEALDAASLSISDSHSEDLKHRSIILGDEPGDWGRSLLWIIYKIRCNLFHGEKDFLEKQKETVQSCSILTEIISRQILLKLITPTVKRPVK